MSDIGNYSHCIISDLSTIKFYNWVFPLNNYVLVLVHMFKYTRHYLQSSILFSPTWYLYLSKHHFFVGGLFALQRTVLVDVSGITQISKTTGFVMMAASVARLIGIPITGPFIKISSKQNQHFYISTMQWTAMGWNSPSPPPSPNFKYMKCWFCAFYFKKNRVISSPAMVEYDI